MIWSEIALIAVSVVLVIVVLVWVITSIKNKDTKNTADDVFIKDGVRYSKDENVLKENGEVKVNLNKGDALLEMNKEYFVGKDKDLLPGKYTVLSANENVDTVNIRVGGLVREYKHFSVIALADGDSICAVSSNIILR